MAAVVVVWNGRYLDLNRVASSLRNEIGRPVVWRKALRGGGWSRREHLRRRCRRAGAGGRS